MVLASFIPARCWMAPEIPTAMYKSGATTLPVCPTCSELSQKPASTAALEAPMAAFNFSANGLMILSNSSLFFNPRPPETTTLADPRSGLSLLTISSDTNSAPFPPSTNETSSTATSLALPSSTGAKAELLTETSTWLSLDLTVARALPAYVGLTKVSVLTTLMMSETGCKSSRAPTRGRKFFPTADAATTKLVYSESFNKLATNGDTCSGK
ncbi:hypothetical protein OGAPHI_002825 [Ogataea philodendri]|uniref:Uncharacterized protein n=1 Tax=Ogataea philodendri TaxID=1378263 RepID=A0A9P8T6R2_9ASCO|nr:uncharacterized protein OGAPHI_002825 [Ogataea philodendri]KAH3667176.1 hypothetical protein OGAPHI_002825 [Ogataea philodendri]